MFMSMFVRMCSCVFLSSSCPRTASLHAYSQLLFACIASEYILCKVFQFFYCLWYGRARPGEARPASGSAGPGRGSVEQEEEDGHPWQEHVMLRLLMGGIKKSPWASFC